MRLESISLRNLKRRWGHTLFLVLTLMVAVATVVTVMSLTAAMKADVDKTLQEYGANIVVLPASMQMAVTYGGITVSDVSATAGELTEEDAVKIATIKRKDVLRGISPKLLGTVEVEGQRFIMVGVQFRNELRMKPWWQVSGNDPSRSRDLLLGSRVASQLGKAPGDTMEIGGTTFTVSGVLLEQLSQEDRVIFADLREAGVLLGKPGQVSLIEVSSYCAECPIEIVVEQIQEKLPHASVTAIQQWVRAELAHVNLVARFSLALTGTVLFVGSLIMFITIMASVSERTREIGVFRAIGFRQSHITRLIMLEGLITGLMGGVLGLAVGTVGARLLSGPVAGLETPASPDLQVLALALALAIIMGTVPTIYPARRAANLDPTTALRSL